MRMRNKIAAAAGATAVVASGLVGLSTANAATYTGVLGSCDVFGSPSPWTSNFDITLSPSNPQVGQTVTVTAIYANGPSNGPISLGAGTVTTTGTVALGGAASGTVALTAPTNAAAVGPWAPMPGATLTGTFTATDVGVNTATLNLVNFNSAGTDIPCTPGAGVSASETVVGPTVAVDGVAIGGVGMTGTQTGNYGRAGDIITVDTSVFSTTGTGTLELCDADGVSNCEGTGTVTGNGSGTLTIPAGATAGARKLVAEVGSDRARADFTVLGQASISLSTSAGGAGTTVTVTGEDFDPGKSVSINGHANAGGQPSPTADAAVSAQVSATGTFSESFTVNDLNTLRIQASQGHRSVPFNMANLAYITAVTGSAPFAASGDSCTAGGSSDCEVIQVVEADVLAGALTMNQNPADMDPFDNSIDMGDAQLNGQDITLTGSGAAGIHDILVKDYRNGTLGWTLSVTFDGLADGANEITADNLSLVTPACTAAANNSNTLIAAPSGAFADANTAITLCEVAAGPLSSGDTTATSGLELNVPSDTAPGNYSGNLSFTLA